MTEKTICLMPFATPLGVAAVGVIDGAVCLCDWLEDGDMLKQFAPFAHRIGANIVCQATDLGHEAIWQLAEYFSGARRTFDLPLKFYGTEFQRRVWAELQKIPYGHTISYYDESVRLGNVLAIRAVAQANRRNPISIIVPCHRVIGRNGSLTGYAGGLDRKEWLLRHESE